MTKVSEKAQDAKKPAIAAVADAAESSSIRYAKAIEEMISDITNMTGVFIDLSDLDGNLTSTERLRLIGVKMRNYGFIEKAIDIIRDYPEFTPPKFSFQEMEDKYHAFVELRHLVWLLEQFSQVAKDNELSMATDLYRDALRVYGSLQELSRAKVEGTKILFDELKSHFRRRKQEGTEPAEHEIERDIKSLLHGHDDGEV